MKITNTKIIEKVLKGAINTATALFVTEPVANVVVEKAKDKVEEWNGLVRIPELYSNDIVMENEQAVIILKELGFKVATFPIREPDIKYKDCFDLQVIDSKPKHKQKVKLGELIYLKYVTAEIIEESKQLFEKLEQEKQIAKIKRAEKMLKLKNKNLQIMNGVVSTIRKKTDRNKNESQNEMND